MILKKKLKRKLKLKKSSDIEVVCSDGIKFMNSLPENSVDLIVTDPPYKTTPRGCAVNSGGMMQTEICKKGQMFKYNDLTPKDYADKMYRVLKEGGHCYVMTNHVNLKEMLNTFENAGFKFTKSLIWDKRNKIMGKYYMSQFEYILFFRKGRGIAINNCGTADILSAPNKKPKDIKGKVLHVTSKPPELMEILILNSSKEGDIVLDPFAGIMTTAIACKRTNRKFKGCEIDPKYFSIGKKLLKGEEIQDVDLI